MFNRPANRFCLWICLTVSVLVAPAASAQPIDLAKVMPEGTLLYFSRGGDAHIDYVSQHTAFGKLLKDPQMRSFLDGLYAAIDGYAKTELDDDAQRETYAVAKRLLAVLAKRPVALALLDVGMGDRGPFVHAAVVVHLGKAEKTFVEDLEKLLAASKAPPAESATVAGATMKRIEAPPPVGALYYGVIEGHFVLATGEPTVEKIAGRIGGTGAALSDSKPIKLPREQIGGNPDGRAYCFFLDVAGVLERVKAILPAMVGDDGHTVTAVLEGIAGSGLRSVVWELHYADRGCYGGLYVHSVGKGGESASKQTSTPLNDADLAIIPKKPSWAFACNIDLSGIYRQVLELIKSYDPETSADLSKQIEKLEEALGFELDRDLISTIGDTIVVYDAPENGGIIFTGMTIVMDSSDPDRLQQSLRGIVEAIAAEINEGAVTVGKRMYRDHAIEYIKVAGAPMPVAPAWTSHDNRVIVALYPQMVIGALDRMLDGGDPKDSILKNPDFVAGRKVLGELGGTVSYSDMRAATEQLYPFLLLLGQMGAGMASAEGFNFDMSSFPNSRALTRHLFAAVRTSRSDPNGTLYASYGPFPFGSQSLFTTDIGTTSMLVSILLPSLSRARELSKRTVCSANLRGIGQAMYIYANDNRDRFPPDFKTLLDENSVTEKQFVCPSSDEAPGDLNACYEYIPGQTSNSHFQNVVMYEKQGCHQNEGGNVLFLDGHVEFVKPYSRVEELVKQTRERLDQQKKKK